MTKAADERHMPERRTESRMLCADMVNVSWKDRSGHTRKSTALLEDISRSGACLQFERSVPVNAHLRIDHPRIRLEGLVRYCVYREIGYFVGLEFDLESRWSLRQFRPQHLLDLQKLLTPKTSRHVN